MTRSAEAGIGAVGTATSKQRVVPAVLGRGCTGNAAGGVGRTRQHRNDDDGCLDPPYHRQCASRHPHYRRHQHRCSGVEVVQEDTRYVGNTAGLAVDDTDCDLGSTL